MAYAQMYAFTIDNAEINKINAKDISNKIIIESIYTDNKKYYFLYKNKTQCKGEYLMAKKEGFDTIKLLNDSISIDKSCMRDSL